MPIAYQYVEDINNPGHNNPNIVILLPDFTFIPNVPGNTGWDNYQQWLADGNVTYPYGYCYQYILDINLTPIPDTVLEFPDFQQISITDVDQTLWSAYQTWLLAGWLPLVPDAR